MNNDAKIRVYKFRADKKIKEGKIPTLRELEVLKDGGIDTSKYAKFAIEKYKPFLRVSQ